MVAHQLIEEALVDGDIEGLGAFFDDPAFPNVDDPYIPVGLLVRAIDVAPLEVVAGLLALGADPNRDASGGFPPLYSAVTGDRADRTRLVGALLAAGADPDQRGVNDYTCLHAAAAAGDQEMVDLLLTAGADPTLRTRIDDFETPAEVAAAAGHPALARRLAG
jgi:ankyrin repeat protein